MNEIALEAKSSMEKSIESLKRNLATLRTGRASPALLDQIMVEYYGDKIALNQISAISTPEPRQLCIKPYDKGDVKAIVAAINASNIGLIPQNDGDVVRLNIPQLTEERRREISKTAKKYGEETKVAIRNIRRDFVSLVKDDEENTEDLIKRIEKEIQEVTDNAVKEVETLISAKEKEIMSI
jgi:ribosome recycling factor